MRAQDHEFVRLLAASNFRDHVRGFDRPANLVRNREIGPHQISRGQQARHALAIFARHDDHGQLVDFSRA